MFMIGQGAIGRILMSLGLLALGGGTVLAGESEQQQSHGVDRLAGSYRGDLPCADCPGIRAQLDLFGDLVFFLRREYLDRGGSFDDIGRWTLADNNATLVLRGGGERPLRFRFEDEDTLRMLDLEGGEIASDLNYDLKRTASAPNEPRLMMTGMYSYMADAGLFTECLTGRRLPVAHEADNAALEGAYFAAGVQPGEGLLVSLEGRIAMRPRMEGAGDQPTLVVERLGDVHPGEICSAHVPDAELENTYWRLTRLGEQEIAPPPGQREPHLVLHPEQNRLAGHTGCNRLMGAYRLQDDRLSFDRLATTRMACPRGMETERALLSALAESSTWKLAGAVLELLDAEGHPVARFAAVYLR